MTATPSLLRPAAAIARHTVLEARRNRLLPLLAALALAALAVSAYLRELALAEGAQLQAAVLAATLRLAAVALTAGFVVTSLAREAADQGQLLLLALPLPRAAYVLGKLAGHAVLAAIPVAVFGLLALLLAPWQQAALWAASLLCECWLVAAFSLLCMLGLGQALPALAASAGFYLLARSIATLQLLGHAPQAAADAGQRWLGAAIDLLALLLPPLERYTRSAWLVYHDGSAAALLDIVLQTALYLVLLGAAAVIDFQRRNW
ncbi:ABC transporter permease [Oxalobacteraceae bacterium A2-2]